MGLYAADISKLAKSVSKPRLKVKELEPEVPEVEEVKPKKRKAVAKAPPKKKVKVESESEEEEEEEVPKKRSKKVVTPPSPPNRKRKAPEVARAAKKPRVKPVVRKTADVVPPVWFEKYVQAVKQEQAMEANEKVSQKQVNSEAKEIAKESWNDDKTRDGVLGKMYGQIFQR
jgi:hypothetical protein